MKYKSYALKILIYKLTFDVDVKTNKNISPNKTMMRMDGNIISQTPYTFYMGILLKCRFCSIRSRLGPKKLHFSQTSR